MQITREEYIKILQEWMESFKNGIISIDIDSSYFGYFTLEEISYNKDTEAFWIKPAISKWDHDNSTQWGPGKRNLGSFYEIKDDSQLITEVSQLAN
jgi:hypothetical protein